MTDYYATSLTGERLRRCYEIAPARVRRYLEEEIRFVAARLRPSDSVLELGCGYGRVIGELTRSARLVVGVDTATRSLGLAGELGAGRLAAMDAAALGFRAGSFDAVICVQNGVRAFRVDPKVLIGEALRVVRSPGRVLFSSYAEKFWPHRLEWFRLQAAEGLVGAIDEEATRPGTIVCRDGLTLGTMAAAEFLEVCGALGVSAELTEVDESSLFCEVRV